MPRVATINAGESEFFCQDFVERAVSQEYDEVVICHTEIPADLDTTHPVFMPIERRARYQGGAACSG